MTNNNSLRTDSRLPPFTNAPRPRDNQQKNRGKTLNPQGGRGRPTLMSVENSAEDPDDSELDSQEEENDPDDGEDSEDVY